MTRRYGFRRGVAVDHSEPSGAVLVASGHRVRLDQVAPAAAEAATALAGAECTLSDLVRATGLGSQAVTDVVHQFDRLGLVRHTVSDGPETQLSLEPMSGRPFGLSCRSPRPCRSARRGGVVLSRFAFSRRHGGRLVLESPLSHYRATLYTPAVAGLLPLLAGGDDGDRSAAVPDGALGACVDLLVHAGLAVSVHDTGDTGDTGDRGEPGSAPGRGTGEQTLAGWSFHDLLFHSRSRPGMHDYPIGRTYPMRGKAAPLPAVPPPRGERLPLTGTGVHRLEQADPSFTAVVERRRSVRMHGSEPITVAALDEFLYRAARVRRTIPADPEAGIAYESSVRPYPSGGGAYDLEIYLVANRCAGLNQGVYHYAADAHALERVAPVSRWTEALLTDAKRGCALRGEPQVLLVLTARFARLSWKYSGMAYSMTLKNVGVLYQTMYLVATAMELAPCALGTGNPALAARVLNLSFAEESSVGEFLLGVE